MEGHDRTLQQSKQNVEKISTSKQSIQVNQLLEMLRESDLERQKLAEELEAMKIQIQTTQSDWEAERKERLQAEEDKERARQVIVKLQEENWSLKKSRMVMRTSSTK